MTLPKTILLSYQIEYETQDITIDELCAKYSITTKALKGYTKWIKRAQATEAQVEHDIIVPQEPDIIVPQAQVEHDIIVPQEPDIIVPQEQVPKFDKETLKSDIEAFKTKAVQHCMEFMAKDAQYAEVKEFKDIVAIVDTIEKSTFGDKSAPVTNTYITQVNNLMSKYGRD